MGNVFSKKKKKSRVAPASSQESVTTPRVASPTSYGEPPDALPIIINNDQSYIVVPQAPNPTPVETPRVTEAPAPARQSPRWTAADQRNYIRMFLASNEWEEWNS